MYAYSSWKQQKQKPSGIFVVYSIFNYVFINLKLQFKAGIPVWFTLSSAIYGAWRAEFRSLLSSTKNLLMILVFNLKSYGVRDRSFVLASAVLWNDFPQSMKDSQSVETFKQKLFYRVQAESDLSWIFLFSFSLRRYSTMVNNDSNLIYLTIIIYRVIILICHL